MLVDRSANIAFQDSADLSFGSASSSATFDVFACIGVVAHSGADNWPVNDRDAPTLCHAAF